MATAIAPQGINLDDVVDATRDRLDGVLDETDARLAQLQTRVRTIKNAKVDAIADTRALRAVPVDATPAYPAQVVLHALGAGSPLVIQIGDVAHDQFAQVFKIDRRYYDRMNAEAPALLAQNLNWWLQHTPAERLLRMLKPTAFDVESEAHKEMNALGASLRLRGVLGKGYRTIDDADLVDAIVPTLVKQGAKLVDFSIDERRMHAKFATATRTMEELREAYATKYGLTIEQVRSHARVNGKDISWVNEPLGAGVTIRHSEVGFASLGASFFTRVAKCLNDYVAENAIAIRHVGGKNGGADEGDVRYVSDATQLLENGALLGRVQDTIAKELDPKAVHDRSLAFMMAKTEGVARPEGVPLFEFVGNIGLNLQLTDTQTEQLKEETQRAVMQEGGETRFAFVQGITAVARQMTDYDRRLDVERTGFQILNDDATAILKLGRDAEKRYARARVN